jgi:hypothetical protein
LIAAFVGAQKEKQSSSSKRSHANDEVNNNNSSTKRPRVEYEQTGYNRGLIPETLMGATDIYDGELMFLLVFCLM